MNREEWEGEYKRLSAAPIAPYLLGMGFGADDLDAIPARTFHELSEMSPHEMVGIADQVGFLKHRQLIYLVQKINQLPMIAEYALNGEWEDFSDTVQARYETMPEAFTYFYDDMPEEYRRDFVIGCYIHHGDSVEECREAVTCLRGSGRDDLPEEYRDLEELTVYRAGEEPIDEAEEYLSWTLDEKVARWFQCRIPSQYRHLYRAHIRPSDVIAYTDDREEREVIQYMGVYDVEEIETM